MATFPDYLWKYDFVHRWLPPEAVTAEKFASEAALFADSYQRIIPLDAPPARERYECEEAGASFLSLPLGFAPAAGIGLAGGHHYANSPTKKKFKPKEKTKQKLKKKKK